MQTATDLMQKTVGDGFLLRRQSDGVEELRRLLDRQIADVRQRFAADPHVTGVVAQTPSIAIRTARVTAILSQKDADVQFVFLSFEPGKKAAHAGPLAFALDDGALGRG